MAENHTVQALPPEAARLASILHERLPELRARYGVKSLALFGSYIRDEQHPGSDLDVLVDFEETPGLIGLIALRDHLSDTLGVTVDLTMRSGLRAGAGRHVIADAVPV